MLNTISEKPRVEHISIEIPQFIISTAIICCNSYGAYIMTKVYKGIYFENYVLFSGILEMIFLILENIFEYDLFLLIIQSLQIIITLYVSKRFLKLYFTLSKKDAKTHIYNYYFITLVIINGLFMVISFVFDFTNGDNHTVDDYIVYAHDTFSAAVSVLLFLFALKISSLINWKLGEVRRRLSSDEVVNDEEGDEGEEEEVIEENDFVILEDREPMERAVDHEIYLKKRQTQLIYIALANLITDFLEFVVFSVKIFLFRKSFSAVSLTYPVDNIGFVLITIEHICLCMSTFMNFIIFFWLIRDCYEVSIIPNIKKTFLDKDIEQTQTEQETENEKISNFLGDL